MSLKIALLLGLIAGIIGVDTGVEIKPYIVSSEFIGKNELKTIRKKLQIKDFSSQPAYRYRVKPEVQSDFENLLRPYTKFFRTTLDDSNDIIYEVFGKNLRKVPKKTLKNLKIKSRRERNFYVFGVEPEAQLAFEKILRNEGVPFKSVNKLSVSVPEVGIVSYAQMMEHGV